MIQHIAPGIMILTGKIITIKKLIDDKKIELTDIMIKTAAWTHNTNVNKAGFFPLTLVTGKAVDIPGLTKETEGRDSLTDAEETNKTMETIGNVTREVKEAEPKAKLKDCQGIRVRRDQHQGDDITGEKLWYQYKEENAWSGPAEVICQKSNNILIHDKGKIRKIAKCKGKPYDLKEWIE